MKTVPPSHFVTVVSPPSNASLVPEADSAFQFGNILMTLYLIPLSSSVLQSRQLTIWHSRSCSTIHFLYISLFAALLQEPCSQLVHMLASPFSVSNSWLYGKPRVALSCAHVLASQRLGMRLAVASYPGIVDCADSCTDHAVLCADKRTNQFNVQKTSDVRLLFHPLLRPPTCTFL